MSFRQKIFLSYVIVFFAFVTLMFPFAAETVKKIASKAMQDRASELVERIQSAPNNDALIRRLKEQKPLIFFRVSVITDERKVLYDSHTKRLLGPRFSQDYVVDHPEVLEAIEEGKGYNEDYSELLGQKFAYYARAFDFHGKRYIIRTAFPYKYVVEITQDLELGVISIAACVLLLFSIMTWFIIHHLTKPISQIVSAITPYSTGEVTTLPEIKIKAGASDEFSKLANTLNSLSSKLQRHINTLMQERNEKEAILESLIEGVIAIDRNTTITYANQTALNMLNFKREDLIGHPFSTTGQNKCLTLLTACQKENIPLRETMTLTNPIKGSKAYVDIVGAPQRDNNGAILVMQDQTSHYRVLEMKKDFVANASHELKTPITIIRGFAETLHDHPELPLETQAEVLATIVHSCDRMTHTIKNLLALSDVENLPESRLEECDLIKIAENCKEMVLNIHPTANIQIQDISGHGILLIADPHLMELALINLIENAAKYSPPPAQIIVSMEDVKDRIIIRVSDKGIGIPNPDLDQIFEKFYTVNKAYSQRMGGSGLGLSIVKTIIEKHFGQISVESVLGEGSTFIISLPKSYLSIS